MDVHCRLLHQPVSAEGSVRPEFVELWDVSGDQERYGALLPSLVGPGCGAFAGVLLCHDLARPASGPPSLPRWAGRLGECACWATPRGGAAPPSTQLQQRLRELGVPVPALVLGLKSDAAAGAGALGASERALALLLAPLRRLWARLRGALRGRALLRAARIAQPPPLLPQQAVGSEREELLFTHSQLCCAAAQGRLDFDALDGWLHALFQLYEPALSSQPGHRRNWSGGGSFDFGVPSSPPLHAAASAAPTALGRFGWAPRAGSGLPRSAAPVHSRGFGSTEIQFDPAQLVLGADEEGRLAWDEEGRR